MWSQLEFDKIKGAYRCFVSQTQKMSNTFCKNYDRSFMLCKFWSNWKENTINLYQDLEVIKT